VGRSQEV